MKTIRIPIYGGRLIVARNQDEYDRAFCRLSKGIGQAVQSEALMLRPGGMTVSHVVDDELVIICGVFKQDGYVLCHESVHCAQAVAAAVGMDPIAESEGFAYLTQWFFEELGK